MAKRFTEVTDKQAATAPKPPRARLSPSEKAAKKKLSDARYYALNKEKWRAQAARDTASGKKAEKARAEYLRNADKYKARSKAWKKANPERDAEIIRLWKNRNIVRVRANGVIRTARRRARLQNVVNTLTAKEWQLILAAHGHSCVYCGATEARLEQDHVRPLFLGGAHTKENVVPACRSCNARKSKFTLEEWEARRAS